MAQTCGHEGCRCDAGDGGYCSDYCRQHSSDDAHEAHACACGHPACG